MSKNKFILQFRDKNWSHRNITELSFPKTHDFIRRNWNNIVRMHNESLEKQKGKLFKKPMELTISDVDLALGISEELGIDLTKDKIDFLHKGANLFSLEYENNDTTETDEESEKDGKSS
ncbi:hypothetical protein BPT24_273 [Tenacibaculum phage pT24]|uniref:Uncharacterized protein n=1 Tax=Tenacibaculum phage pT24 TaxID=1880590 RepID=A0A1B4XX59_9CAUD|nr:hypothetical protein HYP10_gp255 [Tenacibaculum phage pT24]BAV39390.1 hypothetical protein BPT24_273 [Tenacibaculum phage pT24]